MVASQTPLSIFQKVKNLSVLGEKNTVGNYFLLLIILNIYNSFCSILIV